MPAGKNLSLVAHLDANGTPVLGAFENDVSCLEAVDARVTARHTAVAGPVDVLAEGRPDLRGTSRT